jgi:hypothetical protein
MTEYLTATAMLFAVLSCEPPLEWFYACIPPARYVPNPGHCEDPPADSVRGPESIPVYQLCGLRKK